MYPTAAGAKSVKSVTTVKRIVTRADMGSSLRGEQSPLSVVEQCGDLQDVQGAGVQASLLDVPLERKVPLRVCADAQSCGGHRVTLQLRERALGDEGATVDLPIPIQRDAVLG